MRYSREYLDQLAGDARRLDREASSHQRLGHFVLAADKRVAADAIRAQLSQIENGEAQRRLATRFA